MFQTVRFFKTKFGVSSAKIALCQAMVNIINITCAQIRNHQHWYYQQNDWQSNLFHSRRNRFSSSRWRGCNNTSGISL